MHQSVSVQMTPPPSDHLPKKKRGGHLKIFFLSLFLNLILARELLEIKEKDFLFKRNE